MSYENNPWQDAADNTSGIEGIHVKCAKGIWTADDTELETGPTGARFAVIMPTARWGIVKWVDGKPAETDVGRIQDGFACPDAPDVTWSQYTECLVVFVDDDHLGAPGTFTSSSWGGRFAFTKLIKPFARTGAFPLCTLSTKARGDVNKNIDPVFVISGWANPSEFPGFVPAAQLAHTPEPAQIGQRSAALMNDDIPFMHEWR